MTHTTAQQPPCPTLSPSRLLATTLTLNHLIPHATGKPKQVNTNAKTITRSKDPAYASLSLISSWVEEVREGRFRAPAWRMVEGEIEGVRRWEKWVRELDRRVEAVDMARALGGGGRFVCGVLDRERGRGGSVPA